MTEYQKRHLELLERIAIAADILTVILEKAYKVEFPQEDEETP